jgi:hypothetical protein
MTGDQSRLLKPLALANARDAVKALIVAKRVFGIGSLRTDAGCFAPLYARKVQDLHGVSTMAEITYYVALPFLFTDDGILLGDAVECPSASTAIVRGRHVGFVQDENTSIVVPTQQPSVAVLAVVNLVLAIGHLGPSRKQSTATQFRSANRRPRVISPSSTRRRSNTDLLKSVL